MKYLNIVGLLFNFVGSIVFVWNNFVSKEEAIKMGLAAWASYDDKKNLKAPLVQAILKQSFYSRVGVIILAIGFLLQLIAACTL